MADDVFETSKHVPKNEKCCCVFKDKYIFTHVPEIKHSTHSKAVLDDSRITVDTTSIHQHNLYYCDRSYLSHS